MLPDLSKSLRSEGGGYGVVERMRRKIQTWEWDRNENQKTWSIGNSAWPNGWAEFTFIYPSFL
jgi:hypothetical protein